ncbi:hypothetical protein R3P38DRAFT_2803412 [Favolaschia claudopus]|uniref:Histone H2A n=1 Tax=Favolaschia claudopus TaxID=2862362 RepID=A0AAV9ZTE5_9AGAR
MSVESRRNSSFQVAKREEKGREKGETHYVPETLFPRNQRFKVTVAPSKAIAILISYALIRQIKSIQNMVRANQIQDLLGSFLGRSHTRLDNVIIIPGHLFQVRRPETARNGFMEQQDSKTPNAD